MGVNSKIIIEYLQGNDLFYHPGATARASAIKELINDNLPGFSRMKLHRSLLILPATECSKHVSVVHNHCVTSISIYI